MGRIFTSHEGSLHPGEGLILPSGDWTLNTTRVSEHGDPPTPKRPVLPWSVPVPRWNESGPAQE